MKKIISFTLVALLTCSMTYAAPKKEKTEAVIDLPVLKIQSGWGDGPWA